MSRSLFAKVFDRPWVRIILYIIVNALVAIWVFRSLGADLTGARTEVMERQAILKMYQERRTTALAVKAQVEDIKQTEQVLNRRFLSPSKVVDFVLALEAVARDATVKQIITFVPTSKTETAPKSPSLELAISADGNFPTLLYYLARIEQLPYALSLSRLNLSAQARPINQGIEPVSTLARLNVTLKVAATEVIDKLEIVNQ